MDNKKQPVICVIDGVTTAILSAIIFKDRKIDVCIIEEKNTAFDKSSYSIDMGDRVMIDIILSQLQIENVYEIRLPYILLDKKKRLSTFVKYCKIRKKIYKFLSDIPIDYSESLFLGAVTSTFMAFLPQNVKISPMDHGVECMYRCNNESKRKKKWVWDIIKSLYMALTHYNFLGFCTNKGYTLANCSKDYFQWIDYRNFDNTVIERILKPTSEFVKQDNKKYGLFLPTTQSEYKRHMKSAYGEDSPRQLDFELIYRKVLENIKGVDCLVIKFHPSFYAIEGEKARYYLQILENICHENNMTCLVLDELLGSSIGHSLPAEIIVRYISFTTVVAMYSTAVINMAIKNNDLKCVNCYGVIKEFDEKLGRLNDINPHVEKINCSV